MPTGLRELARKEAVVRLAALALLFGSAGCSGSGDASPASACSAPRGQPASLTGIASLVARANSMLATHPDGLTIPCLVESLPRPLAALATKSIFSIQPAAGPRSPRMFLFSGNLVMSIVPAGNGLHLLELAEFTSPTRSIKGEIAFPLTAPLSASTPYDRVLLAPGTRCGFCHGSEQPALDVTAAQTFDSDVLRPPSSELVSLPYLESETLACDPKVEPDRCAMLTAVFSHGKVDEHQFSAMASTIYGE